MNSLFCIFLTKYLRLGHFNKAKNALMFQWSDLMIVLLTGSRIGAECHMMRNRPHVCPFWHLSLFLQIYLS